MVINKVVSKSLQPNMLLAPLALFFQVLFLSMLCPPKVPVIRTYLLHCYSLVVKSVIFTI